MDIDVLNPITKQHTERVPSYSLAEQDRRWSIGRKIMDEENLQALVVFGSREGAFPAPYSMDTFFTNDRPGAIVVFPRDDEPHSLVFALAVNDHMQAMDRQEEVWIRPEKMFGGAPNGHALVTVLKRLHLQNARIGVLGLDPYPPFYFDGPMPYNTWRTVLDNLPDATFRRVGQRFFELTAARSDEEFKIVEWSASVGEKMCRAMLEATRVGATEADIYSAIVAECPKNVGFTAEVELRPGMTFSFEPSCMLGRKLVNLGGTVVVGKNDAIELNELATRLMRV